MTPIAQLLDGERCAVLCLPRYRSLTEDAPYAYLFATTFSLDAWQEEIEDRPYLRTMDTIQLRRGVSLYDQEWEGTASTVVTAILRET